MNIFITGAESTGKSTLCSQLAEHFKAPWVSEYARSYIDNTGGKYEYTDVEKIARHQIEQIRFYKDSDLVFYDTGLIITLIWFEEKFSRVPDWFINCLQDEALGKYLLCEPDIKWVFDPLRENPEKREYLTQRYSQSIRGYGFELEFVSGLGEARLQKAIDIVSQWISGKGNK